VLSAKYPDAEAVFKRILAKQPGLVSAAPQPGAGHRQPIPPISDRAVHRLDCKK